MIIICYFSTVLGELYVCSCGPSTIAERRVVKQLRGSYLCRGVCPRRGARLSNDDSSRAPTLVQHQSPESCSPSVQPFRVQLSRLRAHSCM